MIECTHCGTRNRKGSKYCSSCGQCLEVVPDVVCQGCGRLNPPGSFFCQFCGVALTEIRSAQEQAPEDAEGSAPVPLGETGVPAGASAEARRIQPVDQGVVKEPARRLPSWLYGAKLNAEILPVQGARPDAEQPQASTSSEPTQSVAAGNKYLEGIGEVLASADAWLPSGAS